MDHNQGGAPATGAGDHNQSNTGQDNGGQQSNLEMERMAEIHQALQQQQSENQQLKGTLDKLKSVFSGDDNQGKSNELDTSWYEDILKIGFELEKQGHGMPVTVDIATRLKAEQEQTHALRQQIAQLEQKINHLMTPDVLHDNRVYENIDNHIFRQIEDLYGEVDPRFSKYVSSRLADSIREMQAKAPEKWHDVRRSDDLQRRLVAAQIKAALPQRVREMLHEQYLRESPMDEDDFAEAFVEAKKIEDPKIRERVQAEARARMWEHKFSKNQKNSFRSRIADANRRMR